MAAKYEKAKPSVFAAVQDKIPDGLHGKLEAAFAKGFRLVLEKGSGLIGKTYDADGLRQEYEARERALSERVTGGRLRRLRARSRAAVQGRHRHCAGRRRGARRAWHWPAGYPAVSRGAAARAVPHCAELWL